MRWHGVRTSEEEAFHPEGGPLWEYYKHGAVKICPSFSPTSEDREDELGTGGYGYNAQYVGGSPRGRDAMYIPAKEFMIFKPAETVMLTDTAFLDCHGKLSEYSFCEAPYFEFWNSPAEPSTHFRHNGFTNVAFCDGHVRPMPMIHTHASGWCPSSYYGGEGVVPHTAENYQEARIGFLGEDNKLYDRR